jgi:SET domain-containing protein
VRTIRAGEEITYDYPLDYDGRIGPRARAAYACRCGTPRCRGSMLAGTRRR